MLELLFNFILSIIVNTVNLLLTPFLTAFFALFPSVQIYFDYVTSFFATAFTYVSTILQWFCFTPSMFVLLFDYFLIKYSIQVLIIAIKFGVNMYNKFKP